MCEPPPALDPLRLGPSTPRRRIRGRNFTKADILVHDLRGSPVVVKDYRSRGFLIRNTVGRYLTNREVRAYRAASGLDFLPKFVARLGPFALVLEYVEACPLAQWTGHELDDDFFDVLEAHVAALHARGIAMGDLHHRDVLVAVNGSIYLVDLAMAWVVEERSGRWRHAVFRRLRNLDLLSVARMRARWTGRDTREDADPSTFVWHARGRWVKGLWDRLRGR